MQGFSQLFFKFFFNFFQGPITHHYLGIKAAYRAVRLGYYEAQSAPFWLPRRGRGLAESCQV
jgi:hypothetical protein